MWPMHTQTHTGTDVFKSITTDDIPFYLVRSCIRAIALVHTSFNFILFAASSIGFISIDGFPFAVNALSVGNRIWCAVIDIIIFIWDFIRRQSMQLQHSVVCNLKIYHINCMLMRWVESAGVRREKANDWSATVWALCSSIANTTWIMAMRLIW